MATGPKQHLLRFGLFKVDLEAGQLRKNGRRVRLPGQPFRVLALMLDKPGRVVTREELRERLWPDGTFVDFDKGVNTAIQKIRGALGDSASSPRFVETLPGRGYRFLAPVEGDGVQPEGERAKPPATPVDPQQTIRKQRIALIGLAAAFLISAIAFLVSGWSGEPSRTAPVRRYSIAPAGLLPTALWPTVAVSPNGRYIAYLAHSEQSDLTLWLHDLTVDAAREIARVNLEASPFWSPDSGFLAFKTGSELKRVSIGGGQPTTVCKLDRIQEGAWSPDGASIVVRAGGGLKAKLYQVPAGGGDPKLLAGKSGAGLNFLPPPRESYLLYVANSFRSTGRIILRNLDNGEETDLRAGGSPVYSPSGHILYQTGFEDETIWALPFSLADLEPKGEPFPVGEGAHPASVTADGTLVYYEPSRTGLQRLVWRDRQGRKVGEIGQPQKEIFLPSLSPDGRYVGVEGVEESTGEDVWLHEVERPIKTRLTFDPARESRSIWSPDSREVVFWSNRNGRVDLFVKAIDGSSEAVEVLATPHGAYPDAWSPDGRHLLSQTLRVLHSLERRQDGTWSEPVRYTDGDSPEAASQFSPDGRFVAYWSNESGTDEVYVRPFSRAPGKWLASQDGGTQPRWSRAGTELFYVKKDTLYVVAVSTQPTFTMGAATELFTSPDLEWPWQSPIYDVSLDGQRFVTVETIGEAPPARIRIVHNWYEEFRDQERE